MESRYIIDSIIEGVMPEDMVALGGGAFVRGTMSWGNNW